MRKRCPYILILSAAMIFAAVLMAAGSDGRSAAAAGTATEGLSASQASTYRQHCAKCHGNDGRGDTPKGRELDADDLTTAKVKRMSSSRLAAIIRNGKGDMPAFSKKLTAAQVAELVKYVKAL
ncbi:MAG: cytochrome c [Acidobacteria bacterium]|nr:cytochrome c [Acidobacteriota bacterium]MCW5948194.1 cytochrome c [Pyrinomonadaceae bacterium]